MTQSNLSTYKEAQQSLYDLLFDLMPDLNVVVMKTKREPSKEEKSLYNIWSDASNKINSRKLQAPPYINKDEIEKLEKAGLIQLQGKELKVTEKGGKAICNMILNDERSTFHKKSSGDGIVKTASKKEEKLFNWYRNIK